MDRIEALGHKVVGWGSAVLLVVLAIVLIAEHVVGHPLIGGGA